MCYNYLWGGGPDKVKRITVVHGYEQGGLRVIDINKLIVALKDNVVKKILHVQY